MRLFWKRGVTAGLAMLLFAGLFAGCGKAGSRDRLPTPTPYTGKEQRENEPTGTPAKLTEDSAWLQPADSYEAVYNALKSVRESKSDRNAPGYVSDGIMWLEDALDLNIAKESEAMTALPEESAAGGFDFSETNVQVEGIDEGDLVKTDGRYLYLFDMKRNVVHIVSVNGGEMKLMSDIPVSDEFSGNETGREMYLLGDRLVLLVSGFRMQEPEDISIRKDGGYKTYPYYGERAVTKVVTYDVSDRTAPRLLSSLEQDGRMLTSRCTDGRVYVISSHRTYDRYYAIEEIEEDNGELARYLPMVSGKNISADCIYISEEPVSEEFLVVTAMSPEEPQDYLDVKSLLADGDQCYVSSNYIYVGSSRWRNHEITYDRTELYRFSYRDGVITPAGQVTVKGTLNDQFSMDEFQGYLRIVTTVNEYEHKSKKDVSNEESNALYIYDENLQLTGCIEKLAPNEHIKSARLMGNVGYFVTFRQTDPLFSVDLSDPANPKVLGELKIPGFSTYLHPYGEGLLLGIGYDADETTGWTECVKLSMFDVSDPANVKEVHKHSLTDFTHTGVEADHKAALIDAGKDIIGFPVRGYGDTGEYNVYAVYGYDEKEGFYRKFSEGYAMGYDADFYEFKYELFSSDCRGAYIGDTFYMMNPAYEIKSYDMENWEQTGRVGLVKEVEERQALLEKIKEKNPDPIVIELEANPSTGYTWTTTTEGSAVSLSRVEDIIPEGSKQLPGAPITQRYTFEVRGIGTTKVTFEYARMWESKEPLKRIVYVITVDESLEAKIESVTE